MSKELTADQKSALREKNHEKRQLEKGNVKVESLGNPKKDKPNHFPKGQTKWVGGEMAALLEHRKLAKVVKGEISEAAKAQMEKDLKIADEKRAKAESK